MLNRNQTAPCLLEELCALDLGQSYSSVQAEPCNHVYLTNHDRSRIPGVDQKPNGTTIWSIAAICHRCRVHLDLIIDFGGCTAPCPAEGRPYHHFTYVPPDANAMEDAMPNHRFVCSSGRCQAKAMISLQGPVIHYEDIMYLMDPASLGARLKAARLSNPDLKEKSGADVLHLFQSCINDALQKDENKDIPTDNKMFKACLGEGIAGLLLRLGFAKIEPTAGSNRSYWRLPKPPKHPFDPLWDPVRRQLEDVRDELTVLILERPEAERKLLRTLPQALIRAQHDFERILGIRPADAKDLNLGDAFSGEQIAVTPYRRLGVVPHFTDSSIIWAFERQVSADPSKRQYYLQSFKGIATARESDILQTEAAIAESLQPDTSMNGNSEQEDQENDAVHTYSEALSLLGAHRNTTDEFVWTLMTAKIAEYPRFQNKARSAVRFIADERNSDVLRNQLAGTDAPKPHMDLKRAHTTLGVTEGIEPEHLIAQFETNIKESPGRESEFRDALSVIAENKENHKLNAFVRTRFYSSPAKSTLEEPRPIKNIGNTCYLNSLLQYLFTIKPLRLLLAELDDYREDADPSQLTSKRVGNSKVNVSQVRRALKFAYELDKLFHSLTTARTTCVIPSTDLARLTLVNVVDDEVRRRQSTISGPTPLIPSAPIDTLDTLTDAIDDGEPIEKAESPQELQSTHDEVFGTSEVDAMHVDSDATLQADAILPASETEQPKTNGIDAPPESHRDDTLNGNPPPVPPRSQPINIVKSTDVTQEVENWAKQQDVREVMQNVLSQLRWSIKGDDMEKDGEQIDTISRLFSGKERYTTVTKNETQEKIEPFFEIVLYLTRACNIYTALDDTFDQTGIEGSPDITQYRTITEIPPILQISVSRVGYNKVTGTPFKVEDPLQLEECIYMDRYMANDHILEKRRQAWIWKSEWEQLKVKRAAMTIPDLDMDIAGALRSTKEYLSGLADAAEELDLDHTLIDKPLLLGIDRLADFATEQISQLDSKIAELDEKLGTLFADDTKYSYLLHAVFIHRGDSNAKGGHWFIYIYDSVHSVWRCYNDETISTVFNTRSIFQPAKDWMEGTSSFIVYVREGMLEEIVETVHRDPEPEVVYSPPHSPPPRGSPVRNSQPRLGGTTWDHAESTTDGNWDIDRSGDSNISY